MITNTGKNIIAKYLIGQAPAFASYLALGCGPRPRPQITTKTGVSTKVFTGVVVEGQPVTEGGVTYYTSPITGISSTDGFVVGMTLYATGTGSGSFGGVSQTATVTSIDSATKITIRTTAANTPSSGTPIVPMSFTTGGTASILSVADTSGIWIDAKISITSTGTGTLSSTTDTLVKYINSQTSFTVTPAPTTILNLATLYLEVNPNKKSLDFEMFRVPISSRGYVNDNGVNKIVLTAQMPTEERYEISEIGLYSAGSNTSAGQYDSKTVTAFSNNENWLLSTGNALVGPSTSSGSQFLDSQVSIINGQNVITPTPEAIKISSTNSIFSNPVRAARYEKPRYLDNVFLLRGDTTQAHMVNGNIVTSGTPSFLQITGQNLDLTKNSSSDLIKLAFSLVAIEGAAVPYATRIMLEFSNTDGTNYARMQIDAKDSEYHFAANRYAVVSNRLDDLYYSSGQFSWKDVSVIKAYVSTIQKPEVTFKAASSSVATLTVGSAHGLKVGDWVTVAGVDANLNGTFQVASVPTGTTFTYAITYSSTITSTDISGSGATVEIPDHKFYVALDALRVENISTVNPLYGLVGYSIIQNADQITLVKAPNTNNYIEYRFILDVT